MVMIRKVVHGGLGGGGHDSGAQGGGSVQGG